jgi:hypothetical protein
MKTYEVLLTRTYTVEIEAENEDDALNFTEFYTGDIKDISTVAEQKEHKFKIINIDSRINEAFEVNEITN